MTAIVKLLKALVLLVFIAELKIEQVLAQAEPKEINVAVITELSGPFVANGDDCRIGHQSAILAYTKGGVINGYKVKLEYGDSRGEGKTAITELGKLSAKFPLIAILVNRSQVAMAINQLSKTRKLPLVAVAAHPDLLKLNEFAFRIFPSSQLEAKALATELKKRGIRKIAAVTLQDEYLVALKNELKAQVELDSSEIVYDESLIEGEIDFTSIVSRIAQKQPDAVFANLGINQTGILIKKLRDQNASKQIFSNFWIQKKEVIEAAGIDNIEGSFFVGLSSRLPKYAEVMKSIRADLLPTANYYACHAALGSVLAILENNKNIHTKDDFYKAMSEAQQFKLLDETVPLKNREAEFKLDTFEIHDGIATSAQ